MPTQSQKNKVLTSKPAAKGKSTATSSQKDAAAKTKNTQPVGSKEVTAPQKTAAAKPVKAIAPKAKVSAPQKTAPKTPPQSPDLAKSSPTKNTKVSRLSEITVPSMAQAVASTAAKASYSPISPSQQKVPSPVMIPQKNPKLADNWKTKEAWELIDDEVQAMPDSEYMNEKQLAFFRLKLQQLKSDILANAGQTTEHLREDTAVVPDPTDRATIEEERALELRTRDRERKLLKKIEQSLLRIDAHDYGYCDETGEPIGVGRLLARPTATLSLEAQQRRELKQKMFGD